MLALAAMRYEEPERFRWRNLRRDEPIPFFWWERDMHKNGDEAFIVVAPELLGLLNAHREKMIASGITQTVNRFTKEVRPCDPRDPNAYILPYTTSTSRFAEDVGLCGVEAVDWRQRPFSSHSLRKWFETTLMNDAGLQQRQVDFLMRHHPDVASRYYEMPFELQVEALSKLTLVWPGHYLDSTEGPPEKKVLTDSIDGLTGPTNESILIEATGSHTNQRPLVGDHSGSGVRPRGQAFGTSTGTFDAGASLPRPTPRQRTDSKRRTQ